MLEHFIKHKTLTSEGSKGTRKSSCSGYFIVILETTMCSSNSLFIVHLKVLLKVHFMKKYRWGFFSALDYVLTPTLDSSLELAQADSQTLEAISKACKK